MAFLLSHRSAVEMLRLLPDDILCSPRVMVSEQLLEATRTRLSGVDLDVLEPLSRPIQVTTGYGWNRRTSSVVQSHQYRSPTGKIEAVRVGQALLVSPPELVFLQMAAVLPHRELAFLGSELCGGYGFAGEGDGSALVMRSPSCSVSAMQALIECHPRVRGRRRALRALQEVIEGARSPMEVALAQMLSAPLHEGGYGLPRPELNAALDIPYSLQSLHDAKVIYPDLLWRDAHIVAEYDSDMHHSASSRIARDSVRRNVLEEMGYRVLSVTREQISAPREMDRIAQLLRGALGVDGLPDPSTSAKLQRELLYLTAHREAMLGETVPASDVTRWTTSLHEQTVR